MSYDIVLLSENGREIVPELYNFLSNNEHCTATEFDITYENEDTGVYFQWVFSPYHECELNEQEEPIHDDEIGHLRLNLLRPTAFATEAAQELLTLSKAFPIGFYDLPEDLIYEAFIDSTQLTTPYKIHAQRTVSAYREAVEDAELPYQLPKRALDAIWDWNYRIDQFSAGLGEDLFVPRISFFQVDGMLKTGVIWGDGVPMLCPHVDSILVYRDETAPTKGFFKKRTPAAEVLAFEEFAERFSDWFKPDQRAPRSLSCDPDDHAAIFETLKNTPLTHVVQLGAEAENDKFQIVPFEAVLDEEICIPTSSEGTRVLTLPMDEDQADSGEA